MMEKKNKVRNARPISLLIVVMMVLVMSIVASRPTFAAGRAAVTAADNVPSRNSSKVIIYVGDSRTMHMALRTSKK